jgi:cyclopropane fatty-acyl-phospholipid synthase-like methyltransferase
MPAVADSFFQSVYLEGTPPWDIGRPQADLARLVDTGAVTGNVLDAGCGTGENALYAASLGLEVTGIDAAPAAIATARRKADARGVAVTFAVGDVLDLGAYAGAFDSTIDCGCFHVFGDADRERYARAAHLALREQGRLFLMCFSDQVPGDWGPRRVSQAELRDAFRDGWRVDAIGDAHFEVTLEEGSIHAWLAFLTRL